MSVLLLAQTLGFKPYNIWTTFEQNADKLNIIKKPRNCGATTWMTFRQLYRMINIPYYHCVSLVPNTNMKSFQTALVLQLLKKLIGKTVLHYETTTDPLHINGGTYTCITEESSMKGSIINNLYISEPTEFLNISYLSNQFTPNITIDIESSTINVPFLQLWNSNKFRKHEIKKVNV